MRFLFQALLGLSFSVAVFLGFLTAIGYVIILPRTWEDNARFVGISLVIMAMLAIAITTKYLFL